MAFRLRGAFAFLLIASVTFASVAYGRTGVLKHRSDPDWGPAKAPLMTRWSRFVSPSNALAEYPRPQMTRKAWINLNGLWDYAFTDKDATSAPSEFVGKILVPYPMESALSGLAKKSEPDRRLWYRRNFDVPRSWAGQRALLHFGAVNWDSTVLVNGQQVGAHRGGYDSFDIDITDSLKPGENELEVSAWNPLLSDNPADQVLGKQRLHPSGIFYTASTGIWQTVWLEPVPAAHIEGFKMTPNVDTDDLTLDVHTVHGGADATIEATATDAAIMSRSVASADIPIRLRLPNAHLWTPSDPHLYDLRIRLIDHGKTIDEVHSYFAMRKISLGKDEQGRTRIFLNNKFLFEVGALDQGFWPDGIYTAPTDDALRFDIEAAKKLGFNLLRKHAKVEPERWYYWADKLGMLVWQDMPQGFSGKNGEITDEGKKQFELEYRREIATHFNHPSIIVWTIFNEGWGQHDTEQLVDLTRQLDPTRLVNNTSGWSDKGVGDIADTHAYPGPACGKPEATRAAVDGEFGGVTLLVPGHMWTTHDVYGYGATLTDGKLATKHYVELLKKAYGLRDDPGCSAVVYTQITDVEQESNGLLTYDREVFKLDPKAVAAANRGVSFAQARRNSLLTSRRNR